MRDSTIYYDNARMVVSDLLRCLALVLFRALEVELMEICRGSAPWEIKQAIRDVLNTSHTFFDFGAP